MNKAMREQFAELWRKEYEATSESLRLANRAEFLETIDKPYKAIRRSSIAQQRIAYKLCDRLLGGVKRGIYPENAPKLCSNELGYLQGYVADCYYEIYQEATLDM